MEQQTNAKFNLKGMIQTGAIGGVILILLSLFGMVESFVERDIIYKSLSLGVTLVFGVIFIFGYLSAKRNGNAKSSVGIAGGLITGLVASTMLAILIYAIEPLNLRAVFVNASPSLVEALTFNKEMMPGLLTLVGLGAVTSLLGAIIFTLPPVPRSAILVGIIMVIAVGTLEELVSGVIVNVFKLFDAKKAGKSFAGIFFDKEGLSIQGSIITFVAAAVISTLWKLRSQKIKTSFKKLPPTTQKSAKIFTLIFLFILAIFLPQIMGSYLSEILVIVAIFTLMGFGLNIVVGFAGLLDLGYVAFFAIGAYTMGLLTSTQLPQTTGLTGVQMTFWTALPFAVGASVLWGIMLGVPVLRMRGDYLAIVTLGFGEIIRVLALSNFLQPLIGGAQGILGIPKPVIFGFELKTSQELYYLVVIAAALAAFISWRLRDSRTGRSWMAMREDEDVAEAMGINLIKTKLLAFATGAALSGFAGAIFAAKLGSIYPHSFNLLISINVLSLIIVGGIGSLPGVLVGAFVLVGLPELLREFSEYRMLIFGALLVTMMLVKPEGIWPAAVQKRELHGHEEDEAGVEPAPA